MTAALCDEYPAPDAVDDASGAVDQQALQGRIEDTWGHDALVSLVHDEECGHDNHHAFEDGAEELGLVVTIGVVVVGRAGRNLDGNQGRNRRRHVHSAFEGIGEQGD